jgi:hypothetical protein
MLLAVRSFNYIAFYCKKNNLSLWNSVETSVALCVKKGRREMGEGRMEKL